MFRGVNIVLQNLVYGLILDHLQVIYYMGLEERVKNIKLQIDKVGEAAGGDLMCYMFTVEDAVLRIYWDDDTNMQKSALE